ncbi:RNA polymerase sigma factor [Sphingomonas sp. GB1N7]|uniref:RNA polymerase sigma factor n=1 Tax=Parasphingomonas caseinilytica TaxID=3096158 RepID=UPI002FC840F1
MRAWFARRAPPSDVEDLVQDVMLRMQTRASGDPIDHLQGYLFRVAAAVLADHGRRGLVRQRDAHVEMTDLHHPVEVLTPERVLEGKEKIARLVAGLESLGDRTREVFVLNRFEGMSYGEVAATLGISVSAVEKHIMKALRHLVSLGLP